MELDYGLYTNDGIKLEDRKMKTDSNAVYRRFLLREEMKKIIMSTSFDMLADDKNILFSQHIQKYDPRIQIVVFPFIEDEPCDWASLVWHPELGNVFVSELPWEIVGDAT